MKIFQIGFNRCGTNSLHQFFKQNGIPGVHWSQGKVGRDLKINLTTGRAPFEGHEEYVFYSDLMGPLGGPIFEGHYFFREFFEAYPGALFVLNTRSEDRWIRSRQRRPLLIKRFAQTFGLERDEEVEDLWRRQWRTHHERVRTFFADKPDVLLEFDIEKHGGKELSDFVAPHYQTDPSLWGHVGKT